MKCPDEKIVAVTNHHGAWDWSIVSDATDICDKVNLFSRGVRCDGELDLILKYYLCKLRLHK